MARTTKASGGLQQALRAAAMRHEGVEEAIACAGTPVESAAFKARKKTFLFLSAAHVRLKLDAALPEARALAAKEPGRYDVGSLGWIKVTLAPEPGPPLPLLERWIDESHGLVVGPAGAAAKKAAKKTAKKTAAARR
jgi:hypothetical protein